MRGKSWMWLAVLAGPMPMSLEAQDAVPTVTLTEAINLGLRSHPSVVRARGAVNTAHVSQRVALASWLPSLNLSSGVDKSPSTRYNATTGQVVQVSTPYSSSVSLSANMVLFDGLARVYQGKQAGAQAASADAALVNQRFAVTLQIKQAFFNALAAGEREQVAQTAVQRAEEQLKITREKLAAGSAIRSDTLSATVQLGQARLQVLSAQADRATQEANLARFIGFDRIVRAKADSADIAIREVDTTGLRTEALQNSPAIAQAEAASRVAGATVNVARSSYFPRLTANYSNSRSGASGGLGGAVDIGALNPTWRLSVSLNLPLFDRLSREQTLWNANTSRETAEAEAADARRNVNAQVTQWLASLRSAQISLSIAQASREAADEALRVERERYRLGAATIVTVLQAQQALEQAEVDAVNARVAYQIAAANLEALVGREL